MPGDYEIVGIVADAKYTNPRDPARPMYFRPLSQLNHESERAQRDDGRKPFACSPTQSPFSSPAMPPAWNHWFAARSRTSIPISPIESFKSLDYQVADNFNQERLITRLTGLFGLLALVLASVGLYGITAYSVARRTSEIGLRMALGANRGNVVALVLRESALAGRPRPRHRHPGRIAGRTSHGESTLRRTHLRSRFTLAAAVLVLSAFAALAGFIPARRAASIEPMNALRTE